MTQCPWKIHWGVSQDSTTQCGKEEHGDAEHSGRHPNPAAPNGHTVIQWQRGDRREYTGPWPGPCRRMSGCVLHLGHHGRCAT